MNCFRARGFEPLSPGNACVIGQPLVFRNCGLIDLKSLVNSLVAAR